MAGRMRPALVLVALLAAGCGSSANDSRSATQGMPDALQQLTANPWRLNSVTSTPPIRTGNPVTTIFSTSHLVTGQAPCNTYRGSFRVDNSSLHIGAIGVTQKTCGTSADAAEQRFVKALEAVTTIRPSSRDQLVLEGPGVHLVYAAVTTTHPLSGATITPSP